MEKTIRLFDLDSRMRTFDARVLSVYEDKKMYAVVLDQTAFFPEEGGQTCDQGILGGIDVEHVAEKDGVIIHYLKQPLTEGSTVSGEIDWEKRFSDMQQHSGEHIVSGLVHQKYGYDNVGFHLGSAFVTMDFNGVLTSEQLREIEQKANEVVVSNVAIQVSWPSKEALDALDYRSKKELEGSVRIVTIPGTDVCACCAPHVMRTGEIGMIRLINMESYKGGVRVYMLCGFRALHDYRQKSEAVSRIGSLLSAKPEVVAEAAAKKKQEADSLRTQLNQLKSDWLEAKIRQLDMTKAAICFFDPLLDKKSIKHAWQTLSDLHEGVSACFAGDDETGYQFMLGGGDDAREAGKAMTQALDGRGGGSKEMFQGNLKASKMDIENYFADLNRQTS